MSGPVVALRLARRELRGGVRGFRMFLACLALGVAAIAAVGSMTAGIVAGVTEDARIMLAGDAALRATQSDIAPAARSWLERTGAVSRLVDLRGMARAPNGEARSVVEVKAVDAAYPLYGALSLDPPLPPGMAAAQFLDRRDGVWGAAVDAALLERLSVKLGQLVSLGQARFEIRAVIAAEPDRAAGGRGFLLGPRLLVASDALPDTGLIRLGSLIYYDYRVKLPPETDLVAWRAALARAFPDAGWQVADRVTVTPRLERIIERTTIFLVLVGLTTLLIGGVGVGNAVGAYLGGKIATIATLKCLGAGTGLIFGVYLIQVLAMAALGIAAGIVAGAMLPFALAGLLRDALPVPVHFAVYGAPLALAAGFGFLVTAVFSLWPIARACAVRPAGLFRDTVAPATGRPRPGFIAATALLTVALAALTVLSASDRLLAAYFVAAALGALVVFWLAGMTAQALARRVRGIRHPGLRLAVANLHRPGAPTASLVLSLGLGLTVLVGVALVEGNLTRLVDEALPSRAPDHFFIDIQPEQADGFEQIVHGFAGVVELERTPMLRGRITRVNGVPAEQLNPGEGGAWVLRGDRGVTWSAGPPKDSRIAAGDWWPEFYRGPPLISFDASAANSLGVGVGDTLTVNIMGRDITGRIANTRRLDWRSLGITFALVFSPGALDGAPQASIATLRAAPAVGETIARAVTDRFANITAIRVRDALASVSGMVERLGAAVRFAAGVTLLAGTMVLCGAVAAGHRARIYDSVVLKVLGATRRSIAIAYILEYGILGCGTAALSAVLGTIAAYVLVTEIMQLDWVFLPGAVLGTAAFAGALTIGAGFAGTWRALGHKAAPLLRNA